MSTHPQETGPETGSRAFVQRFALDGLLMIAANGAAGLCYLLVHVVLGRRMDGLEYASLVALIGLLNVLSLGGTALQVVLARFTAESELAGRSQLWMTALRRALERGLFWGLGALALWALLAWPLVEPLAAPSWIALILLGLTAGLQLTAPLVHGALQGLRRFGWLAASSLAAAGGRLSVATLIAYLGGGATWAMIAFVAGAAAALGVGLWPLRRPLRRPLRSKDWDVDADSSTFPAVDLPTADLWRELWIVVLGQGALFLLINGDLILSARVLEGPELEAYGKAAMLARIVVFLPLPLVIAMFPRAAVSAHRGLLLGPLAVVTAVALTAAGLVYGLPDLLLGWMYGDAVAPVSAEAAELARLYALAAVPLVWVEVLMPYLWARRRARGALLLWLPAAFYLVVLWGAPDGPAMIRALGVAALVAAAGLAALTMRPERLSTPKPAR